MNATTKADLQKRMATIIATAAALAGGAGCYGPRIDLNSAGGASGANSGEGSGAATTEAADASPGGCDFDAGFVDGSGYSGILPPACGSTHNSPEPPDAPATAADVLAAIAGTWITCDDPTFFGVLEPSGAQGLDFEPNGLLTGLVIDSLSNLVPLADAVFDAGFEGISGASGSSGSYEPPLTSGSYAVVDSSAELGAGTFQIRITGADGTVEVAQILTYSSPPRIRMVNGNSSVTLVRPVSFKYRAGVCTAAFAGGQMVAPNTDVSAIVTGRWVWCGGTDYPFFGYGFDVPSPGTFVPLEVDETGNLVAGEVADAPLTYGGLLPKLVLGSCPPALDTSVYGARCGGTGPCAGPLQQNTGFYMPVAKPSP